MKKKTKNEKRRNQKKLYRKDDTKTEFKSRKIRLYESSQLRNNATKMLLNKNLKINAKLKLNAFEKMNFNLESINVDHITGETINGLAKYLLDEDNRIRTEFVKTVKSCFERLNDKQQSLVPYIQILLIYIKCGLTHIDQRIVRDSKKLLDYLITFVNDSSLDNNLIQVVNSRLKNCFSQMLIIDLELVLLVLRIVYRNRQKEESSNRTSDRTFKWSSANCTFIETNHSLFEEYEFNFSFPAIAKEKEDVKEEFIKKIKKSVEKEVLDRNWDRLAFTYKEAHRIYYLLKISKILKIQMPINLSEESVFISDEHLQNSKDKLNLKQEILKLLKHLAKR